MTTDLTDYYWHEEALDYMLLDAEFWPSTFRTGWLWSNNQSQAWIEEWIPFDYTNNPYDDFWIGSPTIWIPYHPSSSNFRNPGK